MIDNNTITFYIEANGKILAANKPQVSLFELLSKLKIKSAPKTSFYMISTNFVPAGWYTVNCNIQLNNGQPQTVTHTFSVPGNIPNLSVVPNIPTEPKKKTKLDVIPNHFLKPKKEHWKDVSKKHSRSTGI